MKHPIQKIAIAAVTITLIGTAAVWYRNRGDKDSASFQTITVARSDLWITIGATGTVEPEEVIDVGAQVAGQILSFGKDVNGQSVDYGSQVAEGTILARIDDSLYGSRQPMPRPRCRLPRPACNVLKPIWSSSRPN